MKEIHIAAILFLILIALTFLSFKKTEEIITTTTTMEIQTTTTQIETTTTTIEIKRKEIFIYADRFEPSSIEINLWDEVMWINKDEEEHIIILSNPPIEKRILTGDSFAFQFTFTGNVEFVDKKTGVKGVIKIS